MTDRIFKVGIDVDDVLLPCHDRICAEATRLLGFYVDPEKTPHKLEKTLGKAADKLVWDYIDSTPGWCAPPITSEVQEFLERLRSIADEVVAITSPHTTGTWMQDRHRWLREAGFKKNDIIQGSGKYHVPCHVLADDLLDNHVEYLRRFPRTVSILPTASHNRLMTNLPPLVRRIHKLEEALPIVMRAKLAWKSATQHLDHG